MTAPDAPAPRSSARIAADLDEARRFLREAPPHHGSGTRDTLVQRITALERALAQARARERLNPSRSHPG
ncbi:MAG: hypothetical protein JJT89_03095 [Nitriliruptoraceae bacterium]|nr:hypothetical protein [Nitriliruptoraceae bacterium]